MTKLRVQIGKRKGLGTLKYFREPWAHQATAIREAAKHRDYGLFFEQGAGKTLTVINIARQKYYENGRLLRTLVLCPPIVRANWVEEWRANSSLAKHVVMLDGPGTKRTKQVTHVIQQDKIIITNYESLHNNDLRTALLAWEPELIIFDESHKCKTYDSKTTKNSYKLAKKARHRYILTGTPVLNTASDIFSQYKIMDLGETFGANFLDFRDKYYTDMNRRMPKENYFPNWQPKENLAEQLNEKIQHKSMRVLKKDCMDLPPLVTQRLDVPLSTEQARVYRDLKKDFVAYLDGDSVTATMALTKALRLLQIATGFVCLNDDLGARNEKVFTKNPRDKVLEDVLSEVVPQEKIIIWAVFKRNYDSIRAVCKKLGYELVEVHGGVSDTKKRAAIEAFNDPDGPRILLGHPASAGIGINLVIAPYSLRYSRGWSLGDFLQSRARNYRGGSEQHEKVTEIELVAPGTLDEHVWEALNNKQDLATKILDIKEHL